MFESSREIGSSAVISPDGKLPMKEGGRVIHPETLVERQELPPSRWAACTGLVVM